MIITTRKIWISSAFSGDGSQWGKVITLHNQVQMVWLRHLFSEDFLNGEVISINIGDNIFGHRLSELLASKYATNGATIFGYHVKDPERYGVIEFDNTGAVKSIVEKPKKPVKL